MFMLHPRRKTAFAGLALCVAAASATLAHAQVFQFRFERGEERGASESIRAACETYARIAAVQAEMNEKFRCGYTDPRWNPHIEPHFRWCRFVRSEELWESQRSRATDLQRCFDRLGEGGDDERRRGDRDRFDQDRRNRY
jgi:hypothetical protein